MTKLYKLHNQIKHYEWGSPDYIPRLMGITANGTLCAELWMGSHPGSPSIVTLPSGETSLGALIAGDPQRYLGAVTAQRYGSLPFLFKLLAAEKPLSIQVHPNLAQAREGFERENKDGLAQDAPNRNYRDANHKPEIICALTNFTGMCGFRSPGEITRLFNTYLNAAPLREITAPLLQALETTPTSTALKNFLQTLFALPPEARTALTEYILSTKGEGGEWELAQDFAHQYSGDPAVIAPLYLNIFHLEPGEAVFLKAGVPHAYIHGFGVELMANSDNVLRGGLTPKYIDVPELMKILDYSPLEPQIIRVNPADAPCFTYPSPCEEFSLTVMRGTEGTFTPSAPAIAIVTEGEVTIDGTLLKQGESVFIPPANEPLPLQGNYTLYIASVPEMYA